MNQEQEKPMSIGKKYTESDMLAAFRHGRHYQPYESNGDIATPSLPTKNRPFWEWLRLRDEQIKSHNKATPPDPCGTGDPRNIKPSSGR